MRINENPRENGQILILENSQVPTSLKSFHLVPNLPFKNVGLPLFDPKIGPKK